MKQLAKLMTLITIFGCNTLLGQDSVDVTFRYKNIPPSFLVGEFNGWNNSIWPMSFNGTEWVRTARLPIGGNPNPPSNGVPGAWQYKFYYPGVITWPNDPLNHHVNPKDNDNSFLYTRNPTIYHFLPNQRTGLVDTKKPTISAYLYPKVGTVVDTTSIVLQIDNVIFNDLGKYYDFTARQFVFPVPLDLNEGSHTVILNASTNSDTVTFIVQSQSVRFRSLPSYAQHGITLPNTASGDSTTFRLRVPGMKFVVLQIVPEGGDPQTGEAYLMYKDPASDDWWFNVSLESGTYEYLYQTDNGQIYDPWGRWNGVAGSRFTVGPQGLTAEDYEWQSNDYVRPARNRLVIYELHTGEFGGGFFGLPGGGAGFSELTTLLPYLDSLSVNAIELMPINDFGLIGPSGHSWGYDLNSYFALEPSYGSPRDFKVLVDSAHALGMAVIVDIVFNHLNDTGPLWQMLPDAGPNPYFKPNNLLNPNEDALFFFRDMDHWSPETQELAYEVLKMWIDEYRVDGFRYDFTQGIGWNVNEPDKGILGWADRIAQEYDNRIYQIAEHLPESPALIFHSGVTGGWHDSYHDEVFDEARFRNTDLSSFESLVLDLGAYSGNDTPSSPNRYGSRTEPINMNVNHDEQSLIYEMFTFQGVSLEDAIQRDKLYATLMFTSLGVPLLWQGMEFSESRGWRNDGQKLSYRPVSWNLLQTERGVSHYNYYAALIRHRRDNPALYRGNLIKLWRYNSEKVLVWGFDDQISGEQLMVVANFKEVEQTVTNVPWLANGDWYDIFDQNVFTVDQVPISNFTIPRYSARVFANSPDSLVSSVNASESILPSEFQLFQNYPNPFNPETTIRFDLPKAGKVQFEIYNILGQRIRAFAERQLSAGEHSIIWDGKNDAGVETSSGVFIFQMVVDGSGQNFVKSTKMVKLK